MPHPWGHHHAYAYSPLHHSHFHRHYHRGRGFGRLIFWGLIGGGIWAWYSHRQERRERWEQFLASGGLNGVTNPNANTNSTPALPSDIESGNVRVSGEIKPCGETPRQWHGGWHWGCDGKGSNANVNTPAQQPSMTTQQMTQHQQHTPGSIAQQISAQRQDALNAQSQNSRQVNTHQAPLNAQNANVYAASVQSQPQPQPQPQAQNQEELFLPSYAQFINARHAEQQAEAALLQAQQARQFAEDAYIQALPYMQAKEQQQQASRDRSRSRSGWWWSGNEEKSQKNLLNE